MSLAAAIRAQPWAILPDYLDAIEALAARMMESEALVRVAVDGHVERRAEWAASIAATGPRLDGSRIGSVVRDGAALVPVTGAIFPRAEAINSSDGGVSLDGLMRDVRLAQASEAVERVVLVIDSPGGMVSGMGEAADALRASGPKPLAAYVSGVAASAAYWLAAQAREIVLAPGSSVGSIGVVGTVSRQVATDQRGRRSWEIVSSGAPLKRPDPESEDGRAALQAEIDAIEAVFVADVAAGRRVGEEVVRARYGRGGMLSGQDALAAGMADRIEVLEAALARWRGPKPVGPRGGSRALMDMEFDVRLRRARS